MSKSYDDFLSSRSTSQPPPVLPVYQKTRSAHPGAVLLISQPTAWNIDSIDKKTNTDYSVFNDPLEFNYLSPQSNGSNVSNVINGNNNNNNSNSNSNSACPTDTGTSTQAIPSNSLTNFYNPTNASSNIASAITSISPVPILQSTSVSNLNSPRPLYLDTFNQSLPSNAPDLFHSTDNYDIIRSSNVQESFSINNHSSVPSSLSSSSPPIPPSSAAAAINSSEISQQVQQAQQVQLQQQPLHSIPQYSREKTELRPIAITTTTTAKTATTTTTTTTAPAAEANFNDGDISQSINGICSWVSSLTPIHQNMLVEKLLPLLSSETLLNTKLKIDTILSATHPDQTGLSTFNNGIAFPQNVITSISSASSSPLLPPGFSTAGIRVSSLGNSKVQNPVIQNTQPKSMVSETSDSRQTCRTRRSKRGYNLRHSANQQQPWSPIPPQHEGFRRDTRSRSRSRSRSEGPTHSNVRRIAEDIPMTTSASVSASPMVSPSTSPSSSHSPSPLILPQQLPVPLQRSSTPIHQQPHQHTSVQAHLHPFSYGPNYNRNTYTQSSNTRGGTRQSKNPDDKLQIPRSSSLRNTNLGTVPVASTATAGTVGTTGTTGTTGLPANSANSMSPENLTDPQLLKNVPMWLKSLRLHKYSPILSNYNWPELIDLDDQALEVCGVAALGARRKLLRAFNIVKEYRDKGLIDQSAFNFGRAI